MVATSTRIDPRVTRTRKLLLDAFLSVMGEKSFDDITVQDITTRATVNRATFYAHFVDKHALVDEMIREGFTQMLQPRMATPAGSAEEHLRRLLLAVCDYWTALHSHFSDADIADLSLCVSYFLGFGRLVHVLGLDGACPLTPH